MAMKKILVVDDHEIVLKGMSLMLKKEGYHVLEAVNASQTLMLLQHIDDISLIVCDLSLPTTEKGLELIREIRKRNHQLPVIIFTMHEELWTIKTLMDIGADGIVLKGESPSELLSAVKSVIDGKQYFSEQFCKMRNEVLVSNGILSLREIAIIKAITSGQKNRDIADIIGVSEKTIEFHRCSILKKLGAKNIAEATRRAFEIGLLTMIMLMLTFTPINADNHIDIYCNNGEHHGLADNTGVEISFSKNDNNEWILVAGIAPDSVLEVMVATIDSITVNHPLVNQEEAVDMGVSVLWANCNVGASKPEGFGAFYAFGETEEKNLYDYTTWSFCPPTSDWEIEVYPIDSEISGSPLDPAHVNVSNGWRMPTLAECKELIEKCTHRMLTYNGIAGTLIIADNGNTIFLPLAGTKRPTYQHTPQHMFIGVEGVYMSGTSEYETGEEEGLKYSVITAYGLGIDKKGYFDIVLLNPIFGMNVRPVRDKQ